MIAAAEVGQLVDDDGALAIGAELIDQGGGNNQQRMTERKNHRRATCGDHADVGHATQPHEPRPVCDKADKIVLSRRRLLQQAAHSG